MVDRESFLNWDELRLLISLLLRNGSCVARDFPIRRCIRYLALEVMDSSLWWTFCISRVLRWVTRHLNVVVLWGHLL